MARYCLCAMKLLGMVALLVPGPAVSQEQPPPPPPPPELSPGPAILLQPVQGSSSVPPLVPPPAPPPGWQTIPPPPPFDHPPPVVQFPGTSPGIIRPQQQPGLFAAFEIAVVAPSIQGYLAAPVEVGGVTRTVALPFADLDWTGSPRIELGYRFADNAGAVLAAYRSVVSEGGANLHGFDPPGPAFLKSRLNLNAVDLMYVSPDLALDPLWDLNWNAGVRIGTVYYDSRATGRNLTRRTSNNFVGAGPRIGLDARRYLETVPSISLFGRLETGVIIGGDTQSFEEVRFGGKNAPVGGATRFSEGQSAPMLGLQLGMSYSPPHDLDWFRFTFGYLFEQWWGVGGAGGSSGDVLFQGLFFRGEFRY